MANRGIRGRSDRQDERGETEVDQAPLGQA